MSSLTDEIAQFKKNMNAMAAGHVKVQTVWARVKSVDWDEKKMVATGVRDDLDYDDVLLGLGNVYTKPKVDTICLLGIIENQEAHTFLISADEVDETITTVGQSILTVTPEGFKIERNGETLKSILSDLLEACQIATYTNGAGTTGTANNVATFIAIKNRIPNLLK